MGTVEWGSSLLEQRIKDDDPFDSLCVGLFVLGYDFSLAY